jgi:D-glycero-D-manno-heptose 1,7-bisphosphate phosphatase
MIKNLLDRYPVNVEKSFLIGDKQTDIDAAKAAGITPYLFRGPNLATFVAPLLKVRISVWT